MWKYIKHYIGFLIAAGACMVVEVMVDLFQPSIMSDIVDNGVLGVNTGGVGNMDIVLRNGLLMLGLIVLGFLGGSFCAIFASIGGDNISNLMRKDAFKKILSLSFPQVDVFGTGSLITRVTNDMTQVREMIVMFVRGLIRTSFFFIGSIYFMFRLYPRFGLIAMCALPFIAGVMVLCLVKATPGFARMQEQLDRVNAIMQEDVSGIRIIKACVKEAYEKIRFGKANDELIGTQLHVLVIFAFMTPAMNMLMYLVVILVILVGSFQTAAGSAHPGAIMGAIAYTTQLLQSILSLAMLFQNISRGSASWKRIKQVLHSEPELKDGEFDSETELKGKIEFRDVTFTYPGSANPVLKGVNLTINPGEKFAIMGATGCGKSTLVNLIPRFYDVTGGQILVDGVDVREYKQETLRDKVSSALQKAELFGISVSENIRWGKQDATQEEIVEAAKTAQADEFIKEMPEQYDSIVAERGMSLSGGQRQRMSIARTVLKDAEIYIFDDSTSALDLKTEAAFYRALEGSHPESTKIIVAQRIASVMNADRIAIIEDGKVYACASHEELLETCEIYQNIYNSQMGGGRANG